MKTKITEEQRQKALVGISVIGFGVLFFAAVWYFKNIWGFFSRLLSIAAPFLFGIALAYLLTPLHRGIERLFEKLFFRKKKHPKFLRALSTALTLAILISVLVVFFDVMLPQLYKSVQSIVRRLTAILQNNAAFVTEWSQKLDWGIFDLIDDKLVLEWDDIVNSLLGNITTVMDNLVNISTGVISSLYTFFLSIIAAFYIMMGRERLIARLKKVCYSVMNTNTCERFIRWTRRANKIFNGFISGKVLDSIIIGILCYIVMIIFNWPYPLLVSIIIGVTNIIPFFGPFIGWVPSVLIMLMGKPINALWFTVFIIILQQLDGNIIGPHILGGQVGVSALSIMIAIIFGSGLFGFLGMLLAVPVYALGFAIVKTLVEVNLRKKHLPTLTEEYIAAPESFSNKETKE